MKTDNAKTDNASPNNVKKIKSLKKLRTSTDLRAGIGTWPTPEGPQR